jgi:hypothetical protein
VLVAQLVSHLTEMLQRRLAGTRLLPQLYSGYKEGHYVFQYWQNALFHQAKNKKIPSVTIDYPAGIGCLPMGILLATRNSLCYGKSFDFEES